MRQLILLDQAAAIVGRRKVALEAYRKSAKNPLPEPTRRGGGHLPNRYDWALLKPWLERTFGVELPDLFPGSFVAG